MLQRLFEEAQAEGEREGPSVELYKSSLVYNITLRRMLKLSEADLSRLPLSRES